MDLHVSKQPRLISVIYVKNLGNYQKQTAKGINKKNLGKRGDILEFHWANLNPLSFLPPSNNFIYI